MQRWPDWLALSLAPPATPVGLSPAPKPIPALPPAAHVAPPRAAPVPVPVSAPAPPDTSSDEAQVKRLRTLKWLREENLISEAKHHETREAILKSL